MIWNTDRATAIARDTAIGISHHLNKLYIKKFRKNSNICFNKNKNYSSSVAHPSELPPSPHQWEWKISSSLRTEESVTLPSVPRKPRHPLENMMIGCLNEAALPHNFHPTNSKLICNPKVSWPKGCVLLGMHTKK